MEIKKFMGLALIISGLQILILPVIAEGSITGFSVAANPESTGINAIISTILILVGFLIIISSNHGK